MLDEMDKIAKIFAATRPPCFWRCSTPEQNSQFVDNYLEVPFDLSQVLFIATVNDVSELSGPLLDRLEVGALFTATPWRKKTQIALKHLLGRQLREHGLTHPFPEFTPQAVQAVVDGYTREAGRAQSGPRAGPGPVASLPDCAWRADSPPRPLPWTPT